MRHRYNSNLAFNDMLFNMVLGFMLLFVLALILINPITKKADIPAKAEIMMILEWEDEAQDDIDIWVLGPGMDRPLSFQNKHSGYMHLDRDDLGRTTDTIKINGKTKVIYTNREVVTMRGVQEGDYFTNLHVYSRNGNTDDLKVTLTLIDVNPYKEVFVIPFTVTTKGEVIKVPAFSVDKDGNIIDVFLSDMQVARTTKNSAIGRDRATSLTTGEYNGS